MGRKMVTRLLPLFGFLFLTAYVRSASADIVYSDYIRLVNTYLENVWSFRPYMHGDILTRIPANYPERILNVVLFRYSTMFDMMLGAFFLALSAWVAGRYCERKQLPVILTALVLGFIFSLNKWEMLTNGSGWIHFAAFALFWYHYLVWDRYLAGEGKRGDRLRLLLLPWITILFFSGPYCGVYAVTMLIADLFLLAAGHLRQENVSREERREDIRAAVIRMACTFLPLCLYLLSRAHSVEERAGATTESIGQVISARSLLLPVMFVRSFSSMVLGAEAAEHWGIGKSASILLGLLVIGCYAYAFLLNFRRRIYEKTTFPLLLLTSGFLNHMLVTASRWIFLNDAYGMSSRYALQYQAGIAGILLTLAVSQREDLCGTGVPVSGDAGKEAEKRKREKKAAVLITAVFLAGSLLTTGREIHMAPYREEHFIAMRDTALHFESRTDEELKDVLQYHDPVRTRKALGLLRERGLNVFAGEWTPEEQE